MEQGNTASRVSMKMPGELRELLEAEAARQRRSLHNLMLMVLWEYAEKTRDTNKE